VESDLELMSSRVTHTGKLSPVASSEQGIQHLAQVCPFGQKIGDGTLLACYCFLSSFLISAHLCFFQGLLRRRAVSQVGSSQVQEKNIIVLASVWGDTGDLIRKMALLEGKLVEAHRDQEVAEERFGHLMNSSSKGARRLVASKAGRRELCKELSLL
jgi:hypothetical protein